MPATSPLPPSDKQILDPSFAPSGSDSSITSPRLLPKLPPPTRTVTPIPDGLIIHPPPTGFLARTHARLWANRGLFLILISQLFDSLMSVTVRLLETGPQKLQALQILFVRQTITMAGCLLWMWYNSIPHAPLGVKEVRWLLVARGLGGFWGVFGLYYSLTYLDLSDAKVITFLAPIVATLACSIVPALKEPFTRHEFGAAIVSLTGVVLISRPGSLFASPVGDAAVEEEGKEKQGGEEVTPHQRMVAILVALVGVLGAATAFTTIRWIGKRAHPLIAVNYFASWCAVVSLVSLLAVPQIGGIIWPVSWYQWLLLSGIGISGFIMQFCLTAGLQIEKAGRGTNMIYTQMLFALFWERVVWGTTPGWLSIAGSTLILSSAVYVGTRRSKKEESPTPISDEEVGLMMDIQNNISRRGSSEDQVDVKRT